MLFTAQHHSADRSFELVRRSLLQDQDLPFADALTTSQIEQAFEAEGILFGVTPVWRQLKIPATTIRIPGLWSAGCA
jgi:hypothetical protein